MTTGVGSFKSYQLSEGRTTPVPNRVSPTDQIRAEIDALFDGSRELGEVIEDVARLGARLIIQTAVEAEVEVFLGRARYQRSAAAADARPGMRNGYCPATVKTTAGPVTVAGRSCAAPLSGSRQRCSASRSPGRMLWRRW
jgi:hypothetical protein